MNNVKTVFLYGSDTEHTAQVMPRLIKCLNAADISVSETLDESVDLIIVVGGDGTFLRMLRDHSFPKIPIAGLNTGHLGFFMEYMPSELECFVLDIKSGNYSLHDLCPVETIISADGRVDRIKAINDVVVKKNASGIVHLNLAIGANHIERFSGDGLLISTPAGSTSYNYSVYGGIVDPRVRVLQVTPIAPMNTSAYRSFTTGVILPPDLSVMIEPEVKGTPGLVIVDGAEYWYDHLQSVETAYLKETVRLVRKPDYEYWTWVAQKFI
ncbi:MAG: NAD(+)/NADH kinase [Firmicutes bacterium]|nr:NAD(+)/NADH kinase [Bacillota bacterium]